MIGVICAVAIPAVALGQAPRAAAPAVIPRQLFPPGIYPLAPEVEQSLRPKDSFKECDICPEMVVVPNGSFLMGSPVGEPDRGLKEDPQHLVTIPQPFAVARFSISFDDWDACVADKGCEDKGDDGGFGRGRLPAQGIYFAAAKAYVAWISRKSGRAYRLPSESEREYFTRAGTKTPFWFGNTISPRQANYRAGTPYANGPRGEDSKGPVPVDTYAPNPFGIYQVHGNVWEWTEDCHNKHFNVDTPIDGAPWLEGDCTRRIVRGGIWSWSADVARSGHRDDASTNDGKSFRVVRSMNGLQLTEPSPAEDTAPPAPRSRDPQTDNRGSTPERTP